MNKCSAGFTLIEMLIAALILSFIVIIAQQSIYTATESGEQLTRHSQALRNLDRTWLLLEGDLRNAIAHAALSPQQEVLPALRLGEEDEYLLMILRGGQANPLLLPRSEVLRVAYRLEEGVLWRDTWTDAFNPDTDYARSQKVLEGIEELSILALPRAPRGRSISEGPWLETWPEQSGPQELPLALEIRLTMTGSVDELRRLIALAPGGIE